MELTNVWGLLFNISATAGASNFNFDAQVRFVKDHKITRRRKGGVTQD